MNDLQNIQTQIGTWSSRNFKGQVAKHGVLESVAMGCMAPLLGLVEESGELAEATTKEDALDAFGDIGVYLCDYCSRAGLDLFDVVEHTGVDPKHYIGHPTGGITVGVALLCRAHLKQAQGIRGFDDLHTFMTAQHKAVAIIWVGLNRCTPSVELTDYVTDILLPVARKVLKRDWVERPNDANDATEVPQVPTDLS